MVDTLKNDIIMKQFDNMSLIKYKKNKINEENIGKLGKWRSIIFMNKTIISCSPSKSIRFAEFIKKNNLFDCFVEEFVEGTMINCFYIKNKGWEMATKSNIGANCKFASSKFLF